MKSVLTIILVMFVVMAFGAMPAIAATCTFAPDGATGVWALEDNWDNCGGDYPRAGDTAVIPNGKTCRVETASQQIEHLTISQGATVRVVGDEDDRTLMIWGDSTINGTLKLENGDNNNSSLGFGQEHERNPVKLAGSGTIRVVGPQGSATSMVYLSFCNGPLCTVTIAAGLTIEGSMVVLTNLVLEGTFRVDQSGDAAWVGWWTGGGWEISVYGGGTFEVSAGAINVGDVDFPVLDGIPTWEVSGNGTLDILPICSGCADFEADLVISGGTLDVEANLCTSGSIDFSGGTIDVASEAYAAFGGTCGFVPG